MPESPLWDHYQEPGEQPGLAHCVTVAKLRELINALEPTDVLWVNRVRNLSIERGGKYIGMVDLLYSDPRLELDNGA